ncbi:glycosyltransferase [Microbulbifer flavimaris]|uniref:Glycosyltransferase n=1 Tax=Microbulbifer flavimaris TaxID=1781068 RepID=A0ABX4HZ89_9GAMM|nr:MULTISPECIES: WecB/TagA/CpsF family glycosyltransferase [Microbulbifer]PCO04639.1 glycosyltransferase [Microbulbifer flavimaris]
MVTEFNTVNVGGLPTLACTAVELAEICLSDCKHTHNDRVKPKLVFSSNGQGVALANSDHNFMAAMCEADIIHADGMSIVFASRIFGSSTLPERIPTTDFIHVLSDVARMKGQRIRYYFLGATPDQCALAVKEVKQKYPHVDVVGWRDGYFSNDEIPAVARDIDECAPDVLWLAMGKPRQEYVAIQLKKHLESVGWIKTCGGLFDFLSGKNERAPVLMQSMGLEWLHRLWKNPRKLFVRYATTNIRAVWAFFRHSRRI